MEKSKVIRIAGHFCMVQIFTVFADILATKKNTKVSMGGENDDVIANECANTLRG